MRLFVAFDDTDTIDAERGTGKVGRWFEDELPQGCRLWAVVRQQLLVHPDVPYTSHNSAAVVVIDLDGDGDTATGAPRTMLESIAPRTMLEPVAPGTMPEPVAEIIERAVAHLERHWMEGSDPGLCVAWDGCPALPALAAFGRRAAVSLVTQDEARAAATGGHLSGHGGTNDGIIGAAAGVGLTWEGWAGRLIELRAAGGRLRDFPDPVRVGALESAGMTVVTLDRQAPLPLPDDKVRTNDWLRPRLWGGRAVVPVQRAPNGAWEVLASAKPAASAAGN